jgi:hypothetical protein
VQEEVDVDLLPLGPVRAHGEVAPVLLAPAAREAPAALGQDELLPRVAPAEGEDLARRLDAEIGEVGRVEGEARHPRRQLVPRRHGRDAGAERERAGDDRGGAHATASASFGTICSIP